MFNRIFIPTTVSSNEFPWGETEPCGTFRINTFDGIGSACVGWNIRESSSVFNRWFDVDCAFRFHYI